MASMDSSTSLPALFRDRGLFVLPVSNGKYVIVRGKGYETTAEITNPAETFPSTLPFQPVAPSVGVGEMQFVDQAYNAGLLEHFMHVDGLYLSVRGRKFSPPFDFQVGDSPPLHVRGVQVEIDGGFEGEHVLVVLEAKVDWVGDFIIRQLYYPYRFWRESLRDLRTEKDVRPVFMNYDTTSQTFSFWQYRFRVPENYSSIELERNGRFVLEWKPLSIYRLTSVSPEVEGRRQLIAPQADDVAKFAELPFLVARGIATAAGFAEHFGIVNRQGSYYGQAAEALGLVRLRGTTYTLTEEGIAYVQRPVPERNEMLCRMMLGIPIFYEALTTMLFAPNRTIDREKLMELIRIQGYTGTVLGRRTRTLLAWFEWMERTFGLVEVRGGTVSLERRQRRLEVK